MYEELSSFEAQVEALLPDCTRMLGAPVWVLGNRTVAMELRAGRSLALTLRENCRLIRRRRNAAVLGAPIGTAQFIRLLLTRGR